LLENEQGLGSAWQILSKERLVFSLIALPCIAWQAIASASAEEGRLRIAEVDIGVIAKWSGADDQRILCRDPK